MLLTAAECGRDLHAMAVLGGKGVEDGDLAVVTRHLGVEPQHRGGEHRAPDVGAAAVGEGEVRVHGPVHPGGGELGFRADHPGPGRQEAQQAHRVAPHVHGGAAGEGELVADVAALPERRRERHVDLRDVAQLTRAHDLDEPLGERVVLVVKGLHDDLAGIRVGHLDHGSRLVRIGREGLLAEHVLAGPQGRHRPVAVESVRERVVDGVDVRVLDQLGVGAQDPGNTLLSGELLGPVPVPGRHGRDNGTPGTASGLDESDGGDAGRPQDADPQHAVIRSPRGVHHRDGEAQRGVAPYAPEGRGGGHPKGSAMADAARAGTLTQRGAGRRLVRAGRSAGPTREAGWRLVGPFGSIDPVMVPELSLPAVRRATHDDVDAMAAQLARTFWDDPVTSYIFSNEARREAGLRAYFRTQMRADYLPFGGCYTTDGHAGSAIWAPAGKPLLTGLTAILTMIPVLRYVATNLPTTIRLLNMVESMHPHEPHWYLATLGTAVDRQGRGVGSSLMRPVLTHCDAEGIPCYLESSKERNVPFYRRHGFEVVEEVTLPGGGPPLWTMWREPQPVH